MTKSSLPNLIGFMTNTRLKNANNLSGRQIIYIQKTSGYSAAKRYYSHRLGCVKQKLGVFAGRLPTRAEAFNR